MRDNNVSLRLGKTALMVLANMAQEARKEQLLRRECWFEIVASGNLRSTDAKERRGSAYRIHKSL